MVDGDKSDAGDPASEVSSTALLTPRMQLERLVINCTQAGLDAYRDATSAAEQGDKHSAQLFSAAGRRSLDVAREAADGLDGSREPDEP